MARKTFVLDTNVLLHDSQSIFSLQDNEVVIPLAVIEEMDRFKKDGSETGHSTLLKGERSRLAEPAGKLLQFNGFFSSSRPVLRVKYRRRDSF